MKISLIVVITYITLTDLKEVGTSKKIDATVITVSMCKWHTELCIEIFIQKK